MARRLARHPVKIPSQIVAIHLPPNFGMNLMRQTERSSEHHAPKHTEQRAWQALLLLLLLLHSSTAAAAAVQQASAQPVARP